jgi:uncharacterized protein (DUF1501 family)
MVDAGRVAVIQRTGYANSSRSHFKGTDIWSTANPDQVQGAGWVGRYLDALPAPTDPLLAWSAAGQLPHALLAQHVAVPSIPSPQRYAFASPGGTGADGAFAKVAAAAMASHLPITRPHVSFVNGTIQAAMATLDRVAAVAQYGASVPYPDDGFGQALKAVAGAMARGVGTRIFWVQTSGYDTHAGQNTTTGRYASLMATLDAGLRAFYEDLSNQGLLGQMLMLQFSEFGRRVPENASNGTDHGAAGLMLAIGGAVRGGLYGTAANLNPVPDNPTLENEGADVAHETDFRSVYARVIDDWLGADSVRILGGDFRRAGIDFV